MSNNADNWDVISEPEEAVAVAGGGALFDVSRAKGRLDLGLPAVHQEFGQSASSSGGDGGGDNNYSPKTPHSERTFWRKKGQQLSTWLSGLKKGLSRSGGKEGKTARRGKNLLDGGSNGRLSSSHPNVSYHHLAEFVDSGRHSASASLSSSPRKRREPSLTPISVSTSSVVAADAPSMRRHQTELPPNYASAVDDESLAERKDVSSVQKHRHLLLLQHPFYELDVWLQSGRNLVAKDSCGTSDPYVKFKVAGKMLYKSKTVHKNLNPEWNEKFVVPIEDVFQPLTIKVFDYDWGLQDDFMGTATMALDILDIHQPTDLTLVLSDPGKPDVMGTIHFVLTLIPRSQEDKDQYFHRNTRLADTSRKLKSQIWSSVVTIVLVKGKNLNNDSAVQREESPVLCPWVKFRLGNGKYKSKCCQRTCNPLWREQFDLHMFDDQSKQLEIIVFDGSRYWEDMIGRCYIDLNELEHERTHGIWKDLDNKHGALFLLLTISGTTSSETITDLTNYESQAAEKDRIRQRYNLLNTFNNTKDVGHLTVKVYEAQGLASADLGGKSDPFCVLELVNARLQTQTEYKTLSPSWKKIFTFNVKDIHSVLEVTVYDEDRDHKVEFLGKIAVPLLRITPGEKKWYALKDKKLHSRVKGEILLEMEVIYNPIRACLRTFNPREEKYMEQEEKFKKRMFVNNVLRVREMVRFFISMANFIQSCWEWESPVRSTIAFMVFLIVTYNFQLYMTPFAFLLIYLYIYVTNNIIKQAGEDDEVDRFAEEDDEDERDKEEKKSLKERLQAIQEVILTVQLALGKVASIWESIKNTFNFSVPLLSWLAITLLCVAVLSLYYVPLRVLVIVWGVNKFTKKLRSPHAIPNNEVLDFLSRVPDDEHLVMYRELKPKVAVNAERKVYRKKTA